MIRSMKFDVMTAARAKKPIFVEAANTRFQSRTQPAKLTRIDPWGERIDIGEGAPNLVEDHTRVGVREEC